MPEDIEIEETDDFGTVYGDMITFVAVLFILLFAMVNNKSEQETIYTEMNERFGGKIIEQKKELTGEANFVSDLKGYVQKQALSKYVQIMVEDQKIRLIMNDQILFKPGTSELLPTAKTPLRSFAKIIGRIKNPIVIEGHVSLKPGTKGDSNHNWLLSMHRGYRVLRHFVDKERVPANRLSLEAHGPYRPLASNKTAKGRRANDRVEINIIRIAKTKVE